jgi:hypothetical protein
MVISWVSGGDAAWPFSNHLFSQAHIFFSTKDSCNTGSLPFQILMYSPRAPWAEQLSFKLLSLPVTTSSPFSSQQLTLAKVMHFKVLFSLKGVAVEAIAEAGTRKNPQGEASDAAAAAPPRDGPGPRTARCRRKRRKADGR